MFNSLLDLWVKPLPVLTMMLEQPVNRRLDTASLIRWYTPGRYARQSGWTTTLMGL
jgi:hypothetical protein